MLSFQLGRKFIIQFLSLLSSSLVTKSATIICVKKQCVLYPTVLAFSTISNPKVYFFHEWIRAKKTGSSALIWWAFNCAIKLSQSTRSPVCPWAEMEFSINHRKYCLYILTTFTASNSRKYHVQNCILSFSVIWDFFLLLVLFLLNFRDKRANLLHSLCIFQWRVILEGSFKITLNVIIWSQVSKTLITFERMCLNDLHWTYIQFILHTQRARKTFSGRNTMYALI